MISSAQIIGNAPGTPRESNGGVPMNVQDQTSQMLDLRFLQASGGSTTLKSAAVADEYTVDLNDTTGFVDNNIVGIFDTPTGSFYFATQIGAPSGDTITLDCPIDYAFPSGSTVLNFSKAMNVDGTTRKIFQIGPIGTGVNTSVDITKIAGVITDGATMDDSKFGGIAALTKGCVLRLNNSRLFNHCNFKSNKDIGMFAGKAIEYTDKAGGGEYSMSFEFLFAGQENHGVTIRLDPGDKLEFIIQDDLTDLSSFEVMAQGHLVTN